VAGIRVVRIRGGGCYQCCISVRGIGFSALADQSKHKIYLTYLRIRNSTIRSLEGT